MFGIDSWIGVALFIVVAFIVLAILAFVIFLTLVFFGARTVRRDAREIQRFKRKY